MSQFGALWLVQARLLGISTYYVSLQRVLMGDSSFKAQHEKDENVGPLSHWGKCECVCAQSMCTAFSRPFTHYVRVLQNLQKDGARSCTMCSRECCCENQSGRPHGRLQWQTVTGLTCFSPGLAFHHLSSFILSIPVTSRISKIQFKNALSTWRTIVPWLQCKMLLPLVRPSLDLFVPMWM